MRGGYCLVVKSVFDFENEFKMTGLGFGVEFVYTNLCQ
jgi:hypothetical protein